MTDKPSAEEQRAVADRLLVRAGRQAGISLVLVGLAALALAGAVLALPALLARAVDAVVAGGSHTWMVWCGAVVAVLVVADVADDLAAGQAEARATAWVRRTVLGHLLALGPAARGIPPAGASARLSAHAAAAGKAAPDVVRAAANLVPSVGGLVALALIDPWLALAFLAGLPVVLFLLKGVVRDASSMASGYLATQAGIAGRLVDALGGARTITAAGTAARECRRILGPLPELRRYGMGMWRAQVRLATQDALVLPMLEVVVLAVAGWRLAAGDLSAGQLLAAGQYVQLASGIGGATSTVTRLARARAGAEQVAEVLTRPPARYGTAALPPGPGRLDLCDVRVRAAGRSVLDGVSLSVPGGALVAVVGRSGSGKSVLAALAARLTDPDEGIVSLDGVPLPELARDELRRAVAYGFEQPALLGDTVYDAIAFGARTPALEDVVVAGLAARADDFIRHLPKGYSTPLADAPMSGGERQRTGLARTFAHAGRLVVLDDVASSLDTVTEHEIGRVLTGRLGWATRLVVAHRASTAARADLVVWLDAGRVRAVRPHQELLADPDYRAVFAGDERLPAAIASRGAA